MRMYRRASRALAGAALMTAAVAFSAEAPLDGVWPSNDGLYRLTVASRLEPIRINRLHSWELRVTDAAGKPVEGAAIEVDGGMPAHNHGLPTAPRVTRELGAGRYLLEGMRFHMNGDWTLEISIDAEAGVDTVSMRFGL